MLFMLEEMAREVKDTSNFKPGEDIYYSERVEISEPDGKNTFLGIRFNKDTVTKISPKGNAVTVKKGGSIPSSSILFKENSQYVKKSNKKIDFLIRFVEKLRIVNLFKKRTILEELSDQDAAQLEDLLAQAAAIIEKTEGYKAYHKREKILAERLSRKVFKN